MFRYILIYLAAITEYHRLGGLKSSALISHSFRDLEVQGQGVSKYDVP